MGAILGLNKVEGNLKSYLRGAERKIIDGCRITQDRIVDRARQLVRKKTHLLERSIVNGPIQMEGSKVKFYVFALQPYASYQEYGPSPGGARQWKFTPYLRPAFAEMREFFFKAMKWAMKP